MDGDTKAIVICVVSVVLLIAVLAYIGITKDYAAQMACIDAGKEVISGNCISRAAP